MIEGRGAQNLYPFPSCPRQSSSTEVDLQPCSLQEMGWEKVQASWTSESEKQGGKSLRHPGQTNLCSPQFLTSRKRISERSRSHCEYSGRTWAPCPWGSVVSLLRSTLSVLEPGSCSFSENPQVNGFHIPCGEIEVHGSLMTALSRLPTSAACSSQFKALL